MKKFTRRVISVTVAAAALSIGGSTAALAATCSSGNMCTWNGNDFGGRLFTGSSTKGSLGALTNNSSNSAATNGNNCTATRFYDDARAENGAYFILDSENKVRSNYRDPYLTNGAGRGADASQNWANKVSGWYFINC